MGNNYDLVDIERISIEDKRLYSLMLVMLTKCNAKCVHCYIPEHQDYGMDTYRVKGIIKQARDLGAFNVTFNGGECLLRKDLLELVSYARSLYMRVFIMSNGIALDEDYIRKLSKLHIAEFSTTIFSLDEKIHDKITQVPGSLKKTMENIQLLKKYNISVRIQTPLMEYNKFEYRKLRDYCLRNDFSVMTSPSIFSKANGDTAPHDLQIKRDLSIIVKETDEIIHSEEKVSQITIKPEYSCTAPFNSLDVQYDGKIYACNTLFYELGNVYDDTLEKIWFKNDKLERLRNLCKFSSSECENCALLSKCKRCPGLSLLEDGNILKCSSTAKRLAEKRV